MPKECFRSITMNEEAIDRIHDFIKTNRGKTIPNYIYSPDMLMKYYLDKKEQESKNLIKIANKIKVIPDKCWSYPL